ncbi:MAG: VanZ family protein [Deltaproteobacteria bacterium]|nr:VanZ family protein [Deltaproteobacteria bacterium]RLC07879.1 MAG: hypothetical protein DRH43_11035 [Deltaproteobacteria bacterium]
MPKKALYHFFRYWFPVLFFCIIIFIQSSHPVPEQTCDLPYIDKFLHLTGYALLGILFLRGFNNSSWENNRALIMVASIVLTGIYGASDEIHQHYVPYRTADLWDVVFDFSGGFLGVYMYEIFVRKYPKIKCV